jgi:hypothetical protein
VIARSDSQNSAPPRDAPSSGCTERLALAANPQTASAPFADVVVFSHDWAFRVDEVKVHVCWWHGDHDHIVPFAHGQHVVARLPDARLYSMPGESHMGGLARAEDILGVMIELWTAASSGDPALAVRQKTGLVAVCADWAHTGCHPQALRADAARRIVMGTNGPFGFDPEDFDRVVREASEGLREAFERFGGFLDLTADRSGWAGLVDDLSRHSRSRSQPETAGEAGDGVWAIYTVDADGGAHVEQVYATELDALRANQHNTDSRRLVRFLPYGIAASVLDASQQQPPSP